MYEEVEGASERYGRESQRFGCTGRGCDGLGGAVLVLFCMGEGSGCSEGGGCDFALGGLLDGTVTPGGRDATGGSGSDVDGAGFGEGIFRKDSRDGCRDTDGTASFEERGRTRLGVNAICFSCRKSVFISDVQNVQLVDRDNTEVFRLWEVCCRLRCVWAATDLAELFARSRYKNDRSSTVSRLPVRRVK